MHGFCHAIFKEGKNKEKKQLHQTPEGAGVFQFVAFRLTSPKPSPKERALEPFTTKLFPFFPQVCSKRQFEMHPKGLSVPYLTKFFSFSKSVIQIRMKIFSPEVKGA